MSQARTLSDLPSATPASARLFIQVLQRLQYGHLQLITPDGSHLTFGDLHTPPSAVLHIHDWRACGRIIKAGDIGFAESYAAGWLHTPDLTALLRLALKNEAALERFVFGGKLATLWYRLKHWLRPNTLEGSKRNIHAHYDIGNDFYQLWLDKSWTYSSAIFAGDFSQSLESAQAAKYQRIIDTLALKAGDKVLEIGCGWGGFAEHAARCGVEVHGITISEAQLAVAQARNQGNSAKLWLCDYRDLNEQYDAIVSIEMFEAVGERFWPSYFNQLQQCLKPGAKALVQSITIDDARFEYYRANTDFIQQYIFPGGMLPSPERFVAKAAEVGLKTLDQYHFGADYAETLRRWSHAFSACEDAIAAQGFDDSFRRIWQLYYAYCEAGFDEGRTDVVQFLLQKTR
ncbi:MAG: cyclopropane-fatty-acyl-phospholipid synthase [Proteobacteria bacterium]|nr:cyclopropane-fatty-acyl-phospholipid synthase [Pseudomonadota bacterium]